MNIPSDQRRADYLFVGEEDDKSWVAVMELKGGRITVSGVVAQLQGDADMARERFSGGRSFHFRPVLVHEKGLRKNDGVRLRKNEITLHGKHRQPVLIRCRKPVRCALK